MTSFNVHLRAYPIISTRKNLLISNPDLWSCMNCADTNAKELGYSNVVRSFDIDSENNSIVSPVVQLESSISLDINATIATAEDDKIFFSNESSDTANKLDNFVELRLSDVVELSNMATTIPFLGNSDGHVMEQESVSTLDIMLTFSFLLCLVYSLQYLVRKISKWVKVYLSTRFSLYLDRLEIEIRDKIARKEYKSVISQLLENIPIIQNKLGATHSDTVAFQHFLAKAYMGNLEYGNAETVLRDVVASYEPYGEDGYVALAFEDLAVCLHAQGPHRTEEALTSALTSLRIFTEEALYHSANIIGTTNIGDAAFDASMNAAITSRPRSEIVDTVVSISTKDPSSPLVKNDRTIRYNPPIVAGVSVRRKLGYQMPALDIATNKDGRSNVPSDGSLNDFFWSPACKASARQAASVMLNSAKPNKRNKETNVEQEQQFSLDENSIKENSDEVNSVRADLLQQQSQLHMKGASQSLSHRFDSLADLEMQLKDMEDLLAVASDDQLDFEKSNVERDNDVIDDNVARLKKRIGIIVFNLCNLEEAQKYFESSLHIYTVLQTAQVGNGVAIGIEISEIQEYLSKLAACLGDDYDENDSARDDLFALPRLQAMSSTATSACALRGAAVSCCIEAGNVSPSPSTVMFSGSARPSPNMPTH